MFLAAADIDGDGYVDRLVVAAMQSQDAQEGMKARLEKRTAKFQGK